MSALTTLTEEARIVVDTLAGRAAGLVSPSLRIGVTGLSRAGKTVFITALIHNLMHGGRLPLFAARSSGRLASARLEHQPDDDVPRFQYEDHVDALIEQRRWPDSTRAVSELRLSLEFESASGWNRLFSRGKIALDIVDYPGEWLLDLPLLTKSYHTFCTETLALAAQPARADLSAEWRALTEQTNPDADADEMVARELFACFSAYLRACKADHRALSTLPPGRFLMPGDLEGAPALTFAPLALPSEKARPGSLHAMMERRFEAYKNHVVRPFFREHVARLDRQIVLVDAMQAMNAGADAVADLERALSEILTCFRPGRTNFLTGLLAQRIDRILIAATKADHIHHESHDRLQAIAQRLSERAVARASFSGARVETLAMAAVRATREGTVRQNGDTLPVIIGTPLDGEAIGGETFDGKTETAIFPGDLPEKPGDVFNRAADDRPAREPPIRFVRFRPPALERDAGGATLSLPHIRLDRALEFLIGDRLA